VITILNILKEFCLSGTSATCSKKPGTSGNLPDEELKLLRDASGEIWFEKVLKWALPQFGDDDNECLSEFQAARMQNFMRKRIAEGWVPKYYNSLDKVIIADHVARFYGASLAKMPMGD
jgi:hypothetical protein